MADLPGRGYELPQAGTMELGVIALPLHWQAITAGADWRAFASPPPRQDWILGAGSLELAETERQQPPSTSAGVALNQFPLGSFDGDSAC
ncbi:MAG TPA: hypothetical protein VNF24_09830 [Candidatus Acidoferrales bacterium]|nr:hypothetical protein [Candidatus Acidoferrales bacterium]